MSEFFFNPDNNSDNNYSYENFVENILPSYGEKKAGMNYFDMRSFNYGIFDVYNSFFLNEIKALPKYGEYIINSDEFRIDLISYNIYQSTDFWWMLMEYNDIVDQSELRANTSIYYFNIEALEQLIHRCVVKGNIQKNKEKSY